MLSRRQFLIGTLAVSSTGVGRAAAATTTQTTKTLRLISAARAQIGITVTYDPSYVGLPYPNGDIERSRGVCSDVIVRAYRDALGLDLQRLVHEDMRASFSAYPKTWGLRRPDPNIDHRRVLNLATFWRRHGEVLPHGDLSQFQPGDLVTQLIGGTLPHVVIVSDQVPRGRRLAIHNIGAGAEENTVLFDHQITGRYRFGV